MTRATSEYSFTEEIKARMTAIIPAYHMSPNEIHQYFSKPKNVYIIGCTSEIIEDIKRDFKDPNGQGNYTNSFITILGDTLKQLERDISTVEVNSMNNRQPKQLDHEELDAEVNGLQLHQK